MVTLLLSMVGMVAFAVTEYSVQAAVERRVALKHRED